MQSEEAFKKEKQDRRVRDGIAHGSSVRYGPEQLDDTWDLPCGCVGGHGPAATTCDHPCHWVHRFMFTDSPVPASSAA